MEPVYACHRLYLGAGPHEVTTLTDSTCWVLCEAPLDSCFQGTAVSKHMGREWQAPTYLGVSILPLGMQTLCIQF